MATINTKTLRFWYHCGPIFQAIRDSFRNQQLGNGQPGYATVYTPTTYETCKALSIKTSWTAGADTIEDEAVHVLLTLTSTRVAPTEYMRAEPGVEGATVIDWVEFAAAGKVLATVRSDWGTVIATALAAWWNHISGDVATQNSRLDYDVCGARLRYSARERSIQGQVDWYSHWEHLIIMNNNNPAGQTQAGVTWSRLTQVATGQPSSDMRAVVAALDALLHKSQSISINNGAAIYTVDAQTTVG